MVVNVSQGKVSHDFTQKHFVLPQQDHYTRCPGINSITPISQLMRLISVKGVAYCEKTHKEYDLGVMSSLRERRSVVESLIMFKRDLPLRHCDL